MNNRNKWDAGFEWRGVRDKRVHWVILSLWASTGMACGYGVAISFQDGKTHLALINAAFSIATFGYVFSYPKLRWLIGVFFRSICGKE